MKMKISDIMAGYRPVYPKSGLWADTLQGMLDDPDEKATVHELVGILKVGGSFREPVVLGFMEEHIPGTEDDWLEIPAVVNGTHRLCAYMLAEVEDVFVVRSEDLPEYVEQETGVETIVTLVEPVKDENEHDRVFSILRSFPLNDDVWMESSMGSSGSDVFTMFWDSYTEMASPQVDEVEARIRQLLTERVPGVVIQSVVTQTFRYDEF